MALANAPCTTPGKLSLSGIRPTSFVAARRPARENESPTETHHGPRPALRRALTGPIPDTVLIGRVSGRYSAPSGSSRRSELFGHSPCMSAGLAARGVRASPKRPLFEQHFAKAHVVGELWVPAFFFCRRERLLAGVYPRATTAGAMRSSTVDPYGLAVQAIAFSQTVCATPRLRIRRHRPSPGAGMRHLRAPRPLGPPAPLRSTPSTAAVPRKAPAPKWCVDAGSSWAGDIAPPPVPNCRADPHRPGAE